jgi:hypothetical protein
MLIADIHTSFFARKSATHFLITSALSALAITAISNPLTHYLVFPGTVNNFVFFQQSLRQKRSQQHAKVNSARYKILYMTILFSDSKTIC